KRGKLGLPEVKSGFLPGAGGTQRLPRLIGVESALNLILSGEPVSALLFQDSPLLEQLVDGPVLPAAVAEAKAAALKGASPPKARNLRVSEPALDAFLGFARNTIKAGFPNLPAPLAICDAIEAAASNDFVTGMATERRLFTELMMGPVSSALRHLFFAERAAARIPDIPDSTPVREVNSIAVIGAGTMGAGIAINFLNAGIPVRLLELDQETLHKGVARVAETYEGQVMKGRLNAEVAN